jgi:hypothetical protein
VVKNPTTAEFDCPDHDLDDNHELDIISVVGTNRVVIQTISLGDKPADADGKVRFALNLQPIAFGDYVARARAVAGAIKSDDSADSNLFQRVPGKPGVTLKGNQD